MKWANKERGLREYGDGVDVYGRKWNVQDGSWAAFHGIRIYHSDSVTEPKEDSCLSLNKESAKRLVAALKKAYGI